MLIYFFNYQIVKVILITLDALLCGLIVVSTNVGLFFKDVPDDCFVKFLEKK